MKSIQANMFRVLTLADAGSQNNSNPMARFFLPLVAVLAVLPGNANLRIGVVPRASAVNSGQ